MRNFWIFPALLSLSSVLIFFTNAHFISVLVVLFGISRIVCIGIPKVIVTSFIIMGFTVLFTSRFIMTNQTDLAGNEQEFVVEVNPTQSKVDGDQLQFYGTVLKKKKYGKVKKEKIVGFYQLKNEKEQIFWKKNQNFIELTAKGSLEQPENNRNFAQFNYRKFLKRETIHWVLKINKFEKVEKKKIAIWQIPKIVDLLRRKLLLHIESYPIDKVGEFTGALLFGNSNQLEETTRLNFSKLGLIHLLSISGVHVQYLVAVFRRLFRRFKLSKELTDEALLMMLPLYGALTGGQTSIFRAVSMRWLPILGEKIKLQCSSLDAWSLTLIISLWLKPTQIFSVGFQLSYLLTLFLLLFPLNLIDFLKYDVMKSLFISSMMLLMSIPILAYHFYEFSWATVIATSLFTLIFIYGLLPILLALLIASIFWLNQPFFQFLVEIVGILISWIESFLQKINSIGSFMITTGRPKFIFIFLFFSCILIFIMQLEKRKHRFLSLVTLCVSLACLIFSTRFDSSLKVVVLDVGQGDSILIKDRFGKGAYLIDTGGALTFEKKKWAKKKKNTSIAQNKLIPALKAEGISYLNGVFISHGHVDHMGALAELSESIPIKEISYATGSETKPAFRKALKKLKKAGTRLNSLLAPEEWSISSDIKLKALYPSEVGQGDNRDSLTLYAEIGQISWLFTGDLDSEGELKLLQKYPKAKVNVLKVGHHGSSTSSSSIFLKTIEAKVGLISAGLDNQFQHPRPETISRLKEQNMIIFRTDLDGAIYYTEPLTGQGSFSRIMEK